VLRFLSPRPRGVAVDTAGTAYVTDYGGNQVVKLAGTSPVSLCDAISG